MRNFNISRTLFQLFALGLFVYQFQNSIIKYITGPITTQTSTTTLDEIQQPLIYLCQEEQFDIVRAKKNGYQNLREFTNGKLTNTTQYTWNGEYGNTSYHQIQKRIYKTNYSKVEAKNSQTGDVSDYYDADTEEVYFPLFGFCLNIMSTKKKIYVSKIKEKSDLFLVDPAGANKFSMYKSNAVKVDFGPTHTDTKKNSDKVKRFYDDKAVEIEVEIHDLSIHDGKTCMDYGRMGTSYDLCVQNEMEKFLLEWFNCLPPWFSKNSSLTCEMGKVMEINDANSTLTNEFWNFIQFMTMDTLKPCLPPCVTMHFKLNEISHITNRLNNAALTVKIKDEIKVNTDVYAYDIFNLVVDLGSSLGLWLGLSALSIFDTLVEFYTATKRKYYH